MKFNHPLNRHKILIYLYVEERKDRSGNISDIQKSLHIPLPTLKERLSIMKRVLYISYDNSSKIDLTEKGFDFSRYLWINAEKYMLKDLKNQLIYDSLLNGHTIDPDL